jgi:putative ABC transport system ATP-binding protein
VADETPSHSPANAAAVVARDVWKRYPMGAVTVDALRGVNVALPAGKFIVLLGPSGSGKTTLLNLVGGLDTPSQGELTVCGHRLSGASDRELTEFRRRCVGFVFQMFNLVPTLTALENVRLVGQLVDNDHLAEKCLADVGLADHSAHLPAQLSGGEQQRVAIARAMVKEPSLLLADEPTGAIDAETGRRVLSLMWERTHTLGMTVIVVTHNTAFASVGEIVVRLRSGAIVEVADGEARHPDDLEL